jgi:thioredoxin
VILATSVLLGCGASSSKTADTGKTTTTSSTDDSKEAVASGKPVHLTKDTFKQLVMDFEKNPREWVYEGDKPCIIDFYADWCKPCRMIAPVMEELAKEYEGKIVIYKVDTEAQRELAAVFGIQSLPTVLFVPMEGKPSAQMGAMSKEAYKQIIDEYLLKPQNQQNTQQ